MSTIYNYSDWKNWLKANCYLNIYTWSPGDGVTRYRVSDKDSFFAGDGLVTCHGRKELITWINGFFDGFFHARRMKQ